MARWNKQMRFATTGNPGSLNLHELAKRHANDLWVPANMTEKDAAAFALNQFRRQVAEEARNDRIRGYPPVKAAE